MRSFVPKLLLCCLVGCSSTQIRACDEIFAISCGGCVFLSREETQDARELRDRLSRCGRCNDGERCNLIASNPRCTSDPGADGTPCGTWTSRNGTKTVTFGCAQGLVCNAAYSPAQCKSPGKIRESCAVDADCRQGLFCTSAETPKYCRPGLQLGERCGESEGKCGKGLVCEMGACRSSE